MTAEEMFRKAETGEEFAAACLAEAEEIKAQRYEAALRKIAAWRGYETAPQWFDSDVPLTEYETGANDMLETLADFAKEALA